MEHGLLGVSGHRARRRRFWPLARTPRFWLVSRAVAELVRSGQWPESAHSNSRALASLEPSQNRRLRIIARCPDTPISPAPIVIEPMMAAACRAGWFWCDGIGLDVMVLGLMGRCHYAGGPFHAAIATTPRPSQYHHRTAATVIMSPPSPCHGCHRATLLLAKPSCQEPARH